MVSFSLAGPHTHDTHMHTMASQHSSHSRRRRDFRHAAQARAQGSLAVLLVPLLLLLATVATTQAVRTFTNQASAVASNEVFLRGKYIEVGIHNVASYGTENNPPSATHFNGRDHANNKWNRGACLTHTHTTLLLCMYHPAHTHTHTLFIITITTLPHLRYGCPCCCQALASLPITTRTGLPVAVRPSTLATTSSLARHWRAGVWT